MATVTHVRTLDYVARMLGEDPELLEAIVSNDDNLAYGAIISVYTGPEEGITALTDDGIGAQARGDGQGTGLRGMRERVSAMNGTLSPGPRPGGGGPTRRDVSAQCR